MTVDEIVNKLSDLAEDIQSSAHETDDKTKRALLLDLAFQVSNLSVQAEDLRLL